MKYILLISAATTVLFSCSKNDGGNDPAREQALTTGSWKLSAYTTDYDKDGTYEENTFAILADCEKDNIYTFQVGGNVIKDEGLTKCISSNPQTMTLSWSFMDNQTKLQFAGPTYQIEELTQSSLKLKGTLSYNVIYTRNVKLTYSR
ncbi:MAG TPA: hypothetical protein VFU29_22740 [Chitinophagaceae bacterium]|nr:hypothetical protein [Chitinophagaceae bacterium]